MNARVNSFNREDSEIYIIWFISIICENNGLDSGYEVRSSSVGIHDREFRSHLCKEVRYRDPEDDEAPLG